VSDAYGFHLGQPWWLAAGLVIGPMVWLAGRNLAALGKGRRTAAVLLRAIVVLLLAVLLARPMLVQESRRTTVIAVLDRSQSIPTRLAEAALDHLSKAVASKEARDQLAVVDVAEAASISMLPSRDTVIRRRNTVLTGAGSRLADGIQMAMAIAPPDTAVRIILASEGNETGGRWPGPQRPTGFPSMSSLCAIATTPRCCSDGSWHRPGSEAARRSRCDSSWTARARSVAGWC